MRNRIVRLSAVLIVFAMLESRGQSGQNHVTFHWTDAQRLKTPAFDDPATGTVEMTLNDKS